MHWHIIRTLWWKEVRRQLANRGGLTLAALLIVTAPLLTMFHGNGSGGGAMTGGVEYCFVDYWRDDGWVEYLRQHVPADLQRSIKFRDINKIALPGQRLIYPAGVGAIQLRLVTASDGSIRRRISVWHPTSGDLAVYEIWFWRETARFLRRQAAAARSESVSPGDDEFLALEHEHAKLKGGMDFRSAIAAALIMFALFFGCVYLMPSLMCEERERGVLLAQALSPASPLDILASKFLFYVPAAMGMAALLGGLAKPDVFLEPIFCPALIVAAVGSLAIGLTIASLAKTQRAASMAALCYMLIVTVLVFVCQQGEIGVIPHFALEYHIPRMFHAALTHSVHWFPWNDLIAAAALSGVWTVAAVALFRQRGWQ
jgi:hypothetical protein